MNIPHMYTVAHKKVECVPDGYCLLQVGAKNSPHFAECTDDTGENISELNGSFCEITGLYWLWKNTDDPYLGVTHYRRYFMKNFWTTSYKNILTPEELGYYLEDCDLIIPRPYAFKSTSRDAYGAVHYVEDLDRTRNILEYMSPESVPYFDYILQRRTLSLCNMFVAKREIFDKYMQWLMPILFECSNRIDTSTYSVYDKRLIGYLAEWLSNVWVYMNNVKIKYVPIAQTDRSRLDNIARPIAKFLLYPYHNHLIHRDIVRRDSL